MLRVKNRLVNPQDVLNEAAEIERLMAAGWAKPEIARGLGRALSTVDGRIRYCRREPYKKREAEVASEVFRAAINAGRSVGRIFDKLHLDEKTLHDRLMNGRSLRFLQKGDEKRLTRWDVEARAERVALIGRLMAVGFRKGDVAKGLGLSIGSLEKFYAKNAGTSFREMENRLALEVTEASIRAGRSTKQILQQLDIDETTLKDRLKRMGVRLADLQERVKKESIADIRNKVGRYLSKEFDRIPDGAGARWKASNAAGDPSLYVKAFRHMMAGATFSDFSKATGIPPDAATQIAKVVLRDVRERRLEIAWKVDEFLQPPAVSRKEKQVFRLLAVDNNTEIKATNALGENHAGITAIKISLLKKIPELKGLIRYRGKALGQ